MKQFLETLINLSTGTFVLHGTCRQVEALGSKPVDRIICTWKNLLTGLLQESLRNSSRARTEQTQGSIAQFRIFAYNSQSRQNSATLSK